MHTQKTMHGTERPNRERHPGLIDAFENPHPTLRAVPMRPALRRTPVVRRPVSSGAPR